MRSITKYDQNLPLLLKELDISEHEEYASYDIGSLFISILIKEKMDFTSDENFVANHLQTSRPAEYTFSVNNSVNKLMSWWGCHGRYTLRKIFQNMGIHGSGKTCTLVYFMQWYCFWFYRIPSWIKWRAIGCYLQTNFS